MNVAKDALASYQMAIDVTGTNIANVNTPGYSRQRAVLNTLGVVQVDTQILQLSVEVETVERIYNAFIEARLVEQAGYLGYSEARTDTLEQVETIFDETGEGGLNDLLGRFWSAWDDISANPGGQVERDVLLSASEDLASAFNRLSKDLTQLQQDTDDATEATIGGINATISEIASLNQQISSLGQNNGEANILLDKRMELLKDLGERIDINYYESQEGTVNIFLGNGKPLVVNIDTWALTVREDVLTESYAVTFEGSADPDENLNDVLTAKHKGTIAGLIETRDAIENDYLAKLDELAKYIIDRVNEQHARGFDAYNRVGGEFFIPAGADENIAQNMAVTEAVKGDVNKIAASATVSGDGDNARSIANLKNALTMSGNKATFGDFYGALVSRIGQDSADAGRLREHQNTLMENLVNRREEISGVSLDEEMMNLVKYQLAYNAAARLCTTADELFEVLVNLGN